MMIFDKSKLTVRCFANIYKMKASGKVKSVNPWENGDPSANYALLDMSEVLLYKMNEEYNGKYVKSRNIVVGGKIFFTQEDACVYGHPGVGRVFGC